MTGYPEVVDKIVEDYLRRLRLQLHKVPEGDVDEMVKEIRSHIHESYSAESHGDEVDRILAVLRRLGEPADVVAERLPDAIVSAGRARRLPLYILAGILIGFFGLPLGFGGVAVLVGVLAAITAAMIAFFASAAGLVLIGLFGMGLGLLRLFRPEFWDQLVQRGVIHVGEPIAPFMEILSPAGQGVALILFFLAVSACGLGLFWLGKYMLQGLKFLFNLILEKGKTLAKKRPQRLISRARVFRTAAQ
jgi:uncharacterized membrane protein